MVVREARASDIEPVISLGKALHEQSERAHLKFDEDGAREAMVKCAGSSRLAAFVAEHDGKVVGLIVCAEHRWPHIKGRFVNDVVFFATKPGAGRRLLMRLVAWGRAREADEAICSVSFGGKSADGSRALFTRMGFTYRGGMFAMNLRT